jgi:dUTP pyrophosphatase
MARVYICDACGAVIENPHSQEMKEFYLTGSYEMGTVFKNTAEAKKTVHLCESCYHALYRISEGAKMPDPPEPPDNQTIKIKYLSDEIDKLDYIAGKSDWVDLRAAETVELKKGEYKLIPLGIAMQLPAGYEAYMIPRSSTFKNFGVIQANHVGMIDESYCGDSDQWYFAAIAMRDTVIHVNDRICQFRIMKHQPQLTFEATDTLGNISRGGFGTTRKQ